MSMVTRRIDSTTSAFMEAMLQIVEEEQETTNQISNALGNFSANKLHGRIISKLKVTKPDLDNILHLMCDDQLEYLSKTSESAGGQYQINFALAARAMAEATMQSIIQEKFGTRGVRIFRLLLDRHYLEQNELETMALLPGKEAKDLTYAMLADNYICVKEIPKTTDFAPSRTYYLFCVDFDRLIKIQLEKCYKSQMNLILRRQKEMKENKQLLDSVQKIEGLIAQILDDPTLDQATKEQQTKEIEEGYLSPADKLVVEQHKKKVSALMQAEIHLLNSIFIFEMYLRYEIDAGGK